MGWSAASGLPAIWARYVDDHIYGFPANQDTRPEGSRAPRSLLVSAIIAIVVVDRAQEVREDPLGHVAPLLPRLHVRKAEVDPLVDAYVDHILGCIREAVIGARLLRGCSVRGGHREGHFVGPEEEGKYTGYGAGDVVGARGVVGIVWRVDHRLPVRVASRFGIAVVVAILNGRERPPEDEVELAVPGSDPGIAHGQVGQQKEPRAVTDVRHVQADDVPQCLVPHHEEVGVPEQSEVGLLLRAGAMGAGAQGLDLVVRGRVPLARESRLRGSAKL